MELSPRNPLAHILNVGFPNWQCIDSVQESMPPRRRHGGFWMPENENQTVDGFADNTTQEKTGTRGEQPGVPGSPDPGMPQGAKEPMDAEEFARAKEEARNSDEDHQGGRQ